VNDILGSGFRTSRFWPGCANAREQAVDRADVAPVDFGNSRSPEIAAAAPEFGAKESIPVDARGARANHWSHQATVVAVDMVEDGSAGVREGFFLQTRHCLALQACPDFSSPATGVVAPNGRGMKRHKVVVRAESQRCFAIHEDRLAD
jgi:hypothetical protein